MTNHPLRMVSFKSYEKSFMNVSSMSTFLEPEL